MTRDSFHKKSNLKEIVLADSGSYISTVGGITNSKNSNLDQKLQILQRESISRGVYREATRYKWRQAPPTLQN